MIEPIVEISWGPNETYKGRLEPAGCARDLGSGQMSMMLVVQELVHSNWSQTMLLACVFFLLLLLLLFLNSEMAFHS